PVGREEGGMTNQPIVTLPEFFGAFRNQPEELIFFRAIAPRNAAEHLYRDYPTQKSPIASKKFLTASYVQLGQDSENFKQITDEKLRRGVYFNVNAGGVKDVEIKRFVACFCEKDPADGQDVGEFIQSELNRQYPIAPSIELVTYKSVHRHFLIEGD